MPERIFDVELCLPGDSTYRRGFLIDSVTGKRLAIKGAFEDSTQPAFQFVINRPRRDEQVVDLTYQFNGSVYFASVNELRFLLDGVTDLGETQYNGGNTWVLTRSTQDIPDGPHTIQIQVTLTNGNVVVSDPTSFTVAKPVVDPNPNPDPEPEPTIELVAVTTPNASAVRPTVVGTAQILEATIDSSIAGQVTAVDCKVGLGNNWQPCTKQGSTNVWRRNTALNTVYHHASLADFNNNQTQYNASKIDVHYDIQFRARKQDGTFEYSKYCRALSRNVNFSGITPTAKVSKVWAANESQTMYEFIHSFDRQSFNQSGNRHGKELQATQLVTDPFGVFAGKVTQINVPNGYGRMTAGMPRSYDLGGSYGSAGDQPPSGGLRGQYSTPPLFYEGDLMFFGGAIALNPSFPTPTTTHVSLSQIFPGVYGDNFKPCLMFMLDMHEKISEKADAKRNTIQLWGGCMSPFERSKLFEMPTLRGQWFTFIWEIAVSQDPTKGYLSLYTAQQSINGGILTQHKMPNGTGRNYMATCPPGNDGVPGHFHIYRRDNDPYDSTRQWPTPNPVFGWFKGWRTGTTVAAVNPNTYGSGVILV